MKCGCVLAARVLEALIASPAVMEQTATQPISRISALRTLVAPEPEVIMSRQLPATRIILPAGTALVLLIAGTCLVQLEWKRSAQLPNVTGESGGSALRTLQLQPNRDENGDAIADSLQPVDFVYRVTNTGSDPITGLQLARSCSCQTTGTAPDVLRPGESGELSFQVIAPPAGKVEKKIDLFCDQQSTPIASLDASVRVRVTPPILLTESDDLQLTLIQNSDVSRQLMLTTLEKKDDLPWITGIQLTPDAGLTVQACHVEEHIEPDPQLVRRRYGFPIRYRDLAMGRHSLLLRIQTQDKMAELQNLLRLSVSVIDSVTILPAELRFQSAEHDVSRSSKLTVIRRMGGGDKIHVLFDPQLISVSELQSASSMIATFEVTSLVGMGLSDPVSSEIVFDLGSEGKRTVNVRFDSLLSPVIQ